MITEDLAKRLSLLDSVAYIKVGESTLQLRILRGENRTKVLAPIIQELITDIDREKATYIQKLLTDYEYTEDGDCLSILQGEEREILETAFVNYVVVGGEL